jgi:hypothetical protein
MAEESIGDLYRRYAELCFRMAHRAGTEAERLLWVEMGQEWVQRADRADDEPPPAGA